MKHFYIFVFIFCGAVGVAQTGGGAANNKADDLNCYNKWAQKFDERGADEVADGVYDDIIITIRQGNKADCFNGKVEVKDKKVVVIAMLREDGTYEELKWKWRNDGAKNVTIANGISTSLISSDNKIVNVIWPKKIKPKKAPFKRAPEPVDD
jgi:hypothetical protein